MHTHSPINVQKASSDVDSGLSINFVLNNNNNNFKKATSYIPAPSGICSAAQMC